MAETSPRYRPNPATRAKLAKCEQLLTETDMEVHEIAREVGLHISVIYRYLPASWPNRRGRPPPAWRAEARELLLAGELKPVEVAARVGKSLSTLYTYVPVPELRKLAAQKKEKKS